MGYKREYNNLEKFNNQARKVKENSIKIIEKIKGKCDKQHFKESVASKDRETGFETTIQHYELESGLHVYLWGVNIVISNNEITDASQIQRYGFYEDTMRLQSVEQWDDGQRTPNAFISISGGLNMASIHTRRENIMTTAEHVDYLEDADKNIFDLAENQLNRVGREKIEQSARELRDFKAMVEKEIGPIEQTVESEEERKEDRTEKTTDVSEMYVQQVLAGIEKADLSQEQLDCLIRRIRKVKKTT